MKTYSLAAFVCLIAMTLFSCEKKTDPCATQLPAPQYSPNFILVDKNTGKDIFIKLNLEEYISGTQPCHSGTLGLVNDLNKNNGDTVAHNFFAFTNVRINVGYDSSACHTIYMNINGNDIDTIQFTGKVTQNTGPCYVYYTFEPDKVIYNGTEAQVVTSSCTNCYTKYYVLRK